jgi:hypothetical protein
MTLRQRIQQTIDAPQLEVDNLEKKKAPYLAKIQEQQQKLKDTPAAMLDAEMFGDFKARHGIQ